MVKTTIIALILACQYILSPQFSTKWRMDNPPQFIKEADVIVETAEGNTTSEWVWEYYEPLKPVYEEERAISVHCEDWELEELARLAYLEAGADWMSDECIRAVVEVVFNQLEYGAWGHTLHEVIYSPGNYEPAYRIAETEPSARCREIVYEVYHNGIQLPAKVMFFRAWYYHQWEGAVPEFELDGVYFSSSWWCQ